MYNEERAERTVKKCYHVMMKNGEYVVYSPNLVKKGKFGSLKEALSFIDKMNKGSRLPILEHKKDGTIKKDILPKELKILKSTDNGVVKITITDQKVKVLHARKSVH